MEPRATFDESQIRAAEQRLETALGSPDRAAWVDHYTEDAVFDSGGEHAVVGRASLLAMAAAMPPLSEASIRPLRTEGRDDLAAVWCEASWTSGSVEDGPRTVEVRGILVWRQGPDGVWRVLMEHIG